MQQPPIVIECPECGEKYLLSPNSTTPSNNATIYSDGFYIDELNWRTPAIIGCVTCELGFFPEKGKIIAKPSWTEYNEIWAHLKKAEPPTAGSLALELRARKNMLVNEELSLRLEFWYSGNHSETGRILMSKNEKFRNFWIESLSRLKEILTTENEVNVMLKAEIFRQLGNFNSCIELLKNNSNPFALLIAEQAQKSNSAIFSIS